MKHFILAAVLSITSFALFSQMTLTMADINAGANSCNPINIGVGGGLNCVNWTFDQIGTSVSNDTIYVDVTYTGSPICAGIIGFWNQSTSLPTNLPPGNYVLFASLKVTGQSFGQLSNNVTIVPGCCSFSTLNPISCGNYTSPDGSVYTSDGTYTNVIPNSAGCDSTITINLTIAQNSAGSMTATSCDSYTAPSGSTYSSSGMYNDTIPNTAGCDSIIALNLTILDAAESNNTVVACNSYVSALGNVYMMSGNYADTLAGMASNGCDSIVYLNLTIDTGSTTNLSISSCGAYTTPITGMVWDASGVYNDTLVNRNGCDSILVVDLTVIEVDVNVAQTLGGSVELLSTSSGTVQWVDCANNYSPIVGETNVSFLPTEIGMYAVIVTENGCIDTSMCVNVTGVGIKDNWTNAAIDIYPNPITDYLRIDLQTIFKDVQLNVYDLTGNLVNQKHFANIEAIHWQGNLTPGVYFVQIIAEGQTTTQKVLVE